MISIVLSNTALIVSVVTFALNYRHTRKTAVLSRKPVLIFEYDGELGWILRNIGAGPALNVLVAQKNVAGEWFNPVRVPALSKDGSFALKWLNHTNIAYLGATYTDTEQRPYTSTCHNDLSETTIGTLFGPWSENVIGRVWRQPLNVGCASEQFVPVDSHRQSQNSNVLHGLVCLSLPNGLAELETTAMNGRSQSRPVTS